MPLDSRKSAHILSVIARSYTSRTKTVVFVYASSGSYSYTAISGIIFRILSVIDQEIPDVSGTEPAKQADTIIIAPITTNFTGVVYVADTTTATSGGVAAARKYQIIQLDTIGIVPTGTHYKAQLRRLR
jgi:hypothetical protein